MTWGGQRLGAGRKKKAPTTTIRVPVDRVGDIKAFLADSRKAALIPFYASKVRAGFPSPADDYIESMLNLNEHLISHPAATFLVTASGDSMIGAGIHSGDLLIVDKSIEPADGRIVIAAVGGELTVKRLAKKNGRVQLLPENPNYPPLDITEEMALVIWGVVTHVIHRAV